MLHTVINLHEYLSEFSKKFEMAHMVYSVAVGN
jgi:hypothetical protein